MHATNVYESLIELNNVMAHTKHISGTTQTRVAWIRWKPSVKAWRKSNIRSTPTNIESMTRTTCYDAKRLSPPLPSRTFDDTDSILRLETVESTVQGIIYVSTHGLFQKAHVHFLKRKYWYVWVVRKRNDCATISKEKKSKKRKNRHASREGAHVLFTEHDSDAKCEWPFTAQERFSGHLSGDYYTTRTVKAAIQTIRTPSLWAKHRCKRVVCDVELLRTSTKDKCTERSENTDNRVHPSVTERFQKSMSAEHLVFQGFWFPPSSLEIFLGIYVPQLMSWYFIH